jgi:hypothetical protein
MTGKHLLRRGLPVLVSLAILVYLAATIDLREALAQLSLDTALRFAGPLLVWNFATLAIEAHCLHRVTAASGHAVARLEAARIKAACYLLNLIHFTAGAAALSLLLRRRMGTGLTEAVSAVFVIVLLDMGSVVALAALAAAGLPDAGAALRGGLLVGLLVAVVAGFAFLRMPGRLGPLDALRNLEFLRVARILPMAGLLELVALRVVFVAGYVALTAALFRAYDVGFEPVSLAMKVALLLAISALPIAAAGLGTAQLAFVTLFRGSAPDAELLSMSILLSLGLTLARALLGLAFARELVREVLALQSSMRAASTRSSRDDSRRR